MKTENIAALSVANQNNVRAVAGTEKRTAFAGLMADVQAKNGSLSVAGNSQKSAADSVVQSDFRNSVVNAANASNKDGDTILNGYLGLSGPLIDISGWPTVRYSHTGEIVTPESEAYYNNINQSRLQARQEIVNAGRAKGSSTADILGRILDLDHTMPARFKMLDGIGS